VQLIRKLRPPSLPTFKEKPSCYLSYVKEIKLASTHTLQSAWLELPDGRLFWLQSRCTIGRLEDNDLVLQTSALSRHHALLTGGLSGHTLTDLHSSNGTYVNRELAKRPVPLRDGDEIKIGDLVLRYRRTRQPEVPAALEIAPGVTRLLHDVRPRLCWLLVTDIAGFSTLNEQIGSEAALDRLRVWIMEVRPLLEGNGAQINGYIGDAIFAYWPCDLATPPHVLAALHALETYRPRSPLTFRWVAHHGCALFTKSEKGEELTGQDVNFVFRAEKVAKQFRSLALLTYTAVQTLQLESRCPQLGESGVDGMSGTFAFFGPPRDQLSPAAS
jgi:class 3 adenylate cyclase